MDAGGTNSDEADRLAIAAWVYAGDRQSLQTVFERHAPAALRLAAARLGNLSDADDAVQHAFIAFIAFMRGARLYRPDLGTVRGYLMTAVINSCAQQRRADGSRRAREAASAPPAVQPGRSADPDLRDAVHEALARLPEHQRQPVELRYLAGLEFAEIAAALGRNERTVRGQVTRGLDVLRDTCDRLGLRSDHAALGVAIAAIPSAAVPAEAATRLAGLAASGPSVAPLAASGARKVALAIGGLAAVVAALLALWQARPRTAPEPTPPTADVAIAPAIVIAAPARERRPPDVFWSLPDGPESADVALVTIGAARETGDDGAPVQDSTWWQPGPRDMGDDWWSNPLVKERPLRPEWTPQRLLRPALTGEPCYALCVAPPSDARWHRSLRPAAIVAEPGGWRLVLDGVRAARDVVPAGLDLGRSAFACRIGALPDTGMRVSVEVRWRDLDARTTLLDGAPSITRGSIPVTAGAPGLARIDTVTVEPPSVRDGSRWELIPPMRVRQLTAAEAPPAYGGIVNTSQIGWVGFDGGAKLAGTAVQVLGPSMSRGDAIRLRSLRWDGATATATVAVWSGAGTAPEAERRRPLLPVWIQRPAGVAGPLRLRLAWEHFVERADGGFELQPGLPAFAGTVEAEDLVIPDPATPEPVAPTM